MFAIVMGIRSSGDYMDEGMIASLLSIDCELTMLHNVKPIFKPHARALLMQQQRMAAVTSFRRMSSTNTVKPCLPLKTATPTIRR